MRITIENTTEHFGEPHPPDKVTVECDYDDVSPENVVNMMAACMWGMGYKESTIINGMRAWLEENDPDNESGALE